MIQVNPDESQLEQVGEQLQQTLFVNEPEVVADGAETDVASIEEARDLAGFPARMPRYLPRTSPPDISVKGYSESIFRFPRQGLELFFQLAGMDVQIPQGWEEGEVRAVMPAAVSIEQMGLQVLQVWDPVLEYPQGIDPAMVGQAGLRLMGIAPDEARRISQTKMNS